MVLAVRPVRLARVPRGAGGLRRPGGWRRIAGPPVRGGGGHRESGSRRPGIRDGTDLPRAGSAPTCTRAVRTARRGCLPGSHPPRQRASQTWPRRAAKPPAHPRASVAPRVGLELFAADAAGADNGLAPVPAVAGVVDQLGRLLDDRHLLDPAARPGRVAVVADAGAGDVQVSGGGGVISAGFAAGPSARRRRSASLICACQRPPRGCGRNGWQR